MKYIKFTYVDAVTGVSVASHPAKNGPVFPAVDGLAFSWARESAYPAPFPELFGTCPDTAFTQLDGVIAVFSQVDWENMRADEMAARIPRSVTRRQARQALLLNGQLASVQPAITAIADVTQRGLMQIEWDDSQDFERQNPSLIALGTAIGLTSAQIDALFIQAARL